MDFAQGAFVEPLGELGYELSDSDSDGERYKVKFSIERIEG